MTESISSQSFTCNNCGYDMHDRTDGDPCPECGQPLDTRPNDQVAERWAGMIAIWMIGAILSLPFIGELAFAFLFIATLLNLPKQPEPEYRLSRRTPIFRSHFRKLLIVFGVELVLLIILDTQWPGVFNMW